MYFQLYSRAACWKIRVLGVSNLYAQYPKQDTGRRDIHGNKNLIFQVVHLLCTLLIDEVLGLNACNHSILTEFQVLIS